MKYSVKTEIIQREKGKKSYPLRMRVTYAGRRVDLRLGYSISPDLWDAERECAKTRVGAANKELCLAINRKIMETQEKLDELFNECEYIKRCIPTTEEVKAVLDSTVLGNKISKVFQQFLDENGHLEKATRKIYKATLAQLLAILGDIDISEISADVMQRVVDNMGQRMRNSSIETFVERLRSLLKWAVGKRIYSGNALEYKLKLKKLKQPIVFLTHDELMAFYGYQPKKDTERKVQMAYLFCAFTGLRFSDMKALTWSNVGDGYIEFVTKKTSDLLRVELNKYSMAIMDWARSRRQADCDKVFQTHTIWYHEKLLHRMFKDLGFNDPCTYSYYKGNQRVQETREKWELLSTHTARKTFVVNAVTLGIPVEIIMKWTGHKNMKNMDPYLKIVDEIKRSQMDKFNDM